MKKGFMMILVFAWIMPIIGLFSPVHVEAYDGSLNPVLSHHGGFYNTSFFLTIEAMPHTDVYYTLDGSTPTPSSTLYTSPILIEEQWIDTTGDMLEIDEHTTVIPTPLSMIRTSPEYWMSPQNDIFKATTLKVIAYDETHHTSSDILTETYFVDENMDERYTFLVMSIVTDASHLYDYQTGIQIMGEHYDPTVSEPGHQNRTGNYFMTGDDWERPVHVELFEPSGIKVMALDAGIRIHGGLSRKYPIKSYRLYARSEYDDQNTFDYTFFEDEEIDSFKRLVLRNGGQAYQYTFFGEAFAQHLIKPLGLDIQNSRPVILFINGEYFGIRNIRERLDTHYLNEHYGLNEHQVTILTGHAYMEDGSRSGQLHYQRLYQYATLQDLSSDRKYRQIQRWLDTDNYIDYMITQLFMGNVDWPQNNIFYWRKNTTYNKNAQTGHDGRWRFMINDLDASFGISWGTTTPDVNSFERLTGENWKTGKLFVNLLENDAFKAQFVYRLKEIMNTTLDEDRMIHELDLWVDRYTPEMQEHIDRWGYPQSMDTWLTYVDRMYQFAYGREDVMIQTMEDYLDLGEKHVVSVAFDESKASIEACGETYQSGNFEDYFYNDLPITLHADVKEGYHVLGWYYQDMLLTADDSITLRPEHALSIELRVAEGEEAVEERDLTPWIYAVISVLWSLTAIVFLLDVIRHHHHV